MKGAAPNPVVLSLQRAQKFAEKIVGELSPFCDRIEVAGSIRRGRPACGDIDLVCLPKNEDALDGLRARARKSNPWTIEDGKHQLMLILETPAGPVQLDLFFARHPELHMFGQEPGTWGTILLSRTGSAHHNLWLIERAKRLGLRWNPYCGVFNARGVCVASESEEQIFAALEVEPIRPEDRER